MPGRLASISRQSFLSCETKFFAHLWKDLVFARRGGLSLHSAQPHPKRLHFLPNLLCIPSMRGKSEIALKVLQCVVANKDEMAIRSPFKDIFFVLCLVVILDCRENLLCRFQRPVRSLFPIELVRITAR